MWWANGGWGGCVWGDGVESHGLHGDLFGLLRKVKRACDLTCQTIFWYHIPFWLLVHQEAGESSSREHTWVRYCNRDCDLNIYPSMCVKNGFAPFLCHGLTQFCRYDQVSPTRIQPTERTNGKKILLAVTVHTMLVFLDSFPTIQERCHWFILVGILVSVAKFDVNYGFDLLIQKNSQGVGETTPHI